MTKHIIFDLDGTLIDSMPVWRNTGKRYLESHNIPIPPNLLSVMKKQTLPQTAESVSYTHLSIGFLVGHAKYERV